MGLCNNVFNSKTHEHVSLADCEGAGESTGEPCNKEVKLLFLIGNRVVMMNDDASILLPVHTIH